MSPREIISFPGFCSSVVQPLPSMSRGPGFTFLLLTPDSWFLLGVLASCWEEHVHMRTLCVLSVTVIPSYLASVLGLTRLFFPAQYPVEFHI